MTNNEIVDQLLEILSKNEPVFNNELGSSEYTYGCETTASTNIFVGKSEKELEADLCGTDEMPMLRIGGHVVFFRSWEQFCILHSSINKLYYDWHERKRKAPKDSSCMPVDREVK